MKKQLTLALGLAVLATPALASKARLMALGEDANGSFFINDNRNIFLNAAEANNHADMVTFEWGNNNGNDTDVDTNAEGGALFAHKNIVYGVHLGGQSSFDSTVSGLTNPAGGANSLYRSNKAVDLFIAGDAGFKWGANLTYSSANDDTAGNVAAQKSESDSIDLNVGATFGNISVYADVGLTGEMTMKAAGAQPKVNIENDGVYEVGGSYKMNNYTIFAKANMSEYTGKIGNAKGNLEDKFYTIGAARTERLSDKTMMFVKVSADQSETVGMDGNGAIVDKHKFETMSVPVAIGFEHDATSWLTLRGSVSQAIWSNQEEKAPAAKKAERTLASTTNVNAGATLKLGDFMVDGLIGTGNDGAGNIAARGNQSGVLSMDNVMTRVSMTYRF